MQTEIKSTSKAVSGETHDSYLLSLEPGKAVALTMNFPQHNSSPLEPTVIENNSIQNSHCNHITTDPHGCLDCISTMFGPNYAPFASFSILPNLVLLLIHFLIYSVHEFSEFAQSQKTIAMKQNDLIENFLSYHQQQSPKKNPLNEQELQHVFTYGTWSNGKVK